MSGVVAPLLDLAEPGRFELRDDRPFQGESVAAAIERQARLEIPDIALEPGQVARRDVRRVGGDELETFALNRSEQIAGQEPQAVRGAEPLRVLPGEPDGFRGDVGARDAPGRPRAGEGQG